MQNEPAITDELVAAHGLKPDEYRRILDLLGRAPTYTELGIFSAPRVGWTLQVFGHPNVHILNNFRKWIEEGYATETGEPGEVQPVDYPVPELDQSKVVAFEEVREIAKHLGKEGAKQVQILDARSLGRWKGIDPEPREGILD